MENDKVKSPRRVLKSRKIRILFIAVLIVLGFIFYKNALLPPDLSKCDRIIIYFDPSVYYNYAFLRSEIEDVFSTEEWEYINALNTNVITDGEKIAALAKNIHLAKYKGLFERFKIMKGLIFIYCYNYLLTLFPFVAGTGK